MARFYAEIQGSRGEASRMGTAESGMWGWIRGWHVGATVRMHANGDQDSTLQDECYIEANDGSAGYAHRDIGSVRLVDGELVFTPSEWTIEQVAKFKRREANERRREARAAAQARADRQRAKLREAFRFHLKNGGYCTPPGRAACALKAARAELLAIELGISFVWEDDEAGDDSWMDDATRERGIREGWTWEWARAMNEDGDTLASLGGIIGADDNYRRCIEADLAAEAIATMSREEDN